MGSGTGRVNRTISMKRGKNNVGTVSGHGCWSGRTPEQRGLVTGFAIATETSPGLEMLFSSKRVN